MKKIVIVGGVAGGMSAATRLRRLDEMAEIIILEKGPYVSFANCGLPYHISGEIADRDDLIVQSSEALSARFQLDIRTESEALSIDRDRKTVRVGGRDGEYELEYDALILSPGARPFVPPIEGLSELKHVFTVRNIPDVDRIKTFIENEQPQKAAVIGAGFIGLEMAESLRHLGMDVSVIEMAPHVLPPLDREMAAFAENELERHGIDVITGASAERFDHHTIHLSNGQTLDADLVILSVGVTPESSLAKDAGLELGMRGGIVVDEHYRTSDPDIYAIGDAIIVKHFITGEDTMIALANPANRQGRQVADVIMGIDRKNQGSLGTSILRLFDLSIGSTGLNERLLKQSGYDYDVVHVRAQDHVSYFPGATPINLKLLFNKETGQIYGAQAVGKKGVDKRIDVLSTAIKSGLKVEDLPELELSYAPPFGAAKDIVNMAGYAALNMQEGYTETIQWHELDDYLAEGSILLDVRDALSFEAAHIEGSKNIPLNFLRCRFHELDHEKTIIVSCASGQNSYNAERILKQAGYKVKNLAGALSVYGEVYPEKIVKK